ncbi:MAG: SoxR reducing system RseC family protein [Cyclobacteriaceae bacterium]
MTEQTSIEHSGVITAVSDEKVTVFLEKEECSSCNMKGFCGVTDAERNTFILNKDNLNEEYRRGDRVRLKINLNAGYKALFWAYLMPFLLVAFTIIFTLLMGVSEKWAGLISLLTLPPYYYGLSKSSLSLSNNFKLDITRDE